MEKVIIHVDMDAFYAAVEVRDNPTLARKPLIIGALPSERGVVATCSYEARKYGVHSAMSIKEAYRLCPNGIYMHPNAHKYKEASDKIHEIWDIYTDLVEYVSLDEGYLDVSGSTGLFGGAKNIAYEIKEKIKTEIGLTCSVGIGYSKMSAKLASEEKKPDGFFEIPNAYFLKKLIIDRDVRIIHGVGKKTAEELNWFGIKKVSDIYDKKQLVIERLGDNGRQIVDFAEGIDNRKVTPYSEAKSIGTEQTFQKDILSFKYLRDMLLIMANELSFDIHKKGIYAETITLKITYADMKQITRSKTGNATNIADDIFKTASELLEKIEKLPIRLVGISLSNLTNSDNRQISFMDNSKTENKEKLDDVMFKLKQKYGKNSIKKANILDAESRLN